MKKFSGFVSGVLVTLLVMGLASPAMAALKAKTIEVFTGVTLYVDDVKFTPKDANGNDVEVLLYNGTTYLPVRAIGEAYGKDIAWDNDTKSAYIGYHETPEADPALADGSYDVYFPEKVNSDGTVTLHPAKYVGLTQAEVDALVPGKSVLDFHQYSYEHDSPITVRSINYSADGTELFINNSEAWLYWSERHQMWLLENTNGTAISYVGYEEIILPVASGAKLVDWSTAAERRFGTMAELIAGTYSTKMLGSITVKNGAITEASFYYHP